MSVNSAGKMSPSVPAVSQRVHVSRSPKRKHDRLRVIEYHNIDFIGVQVFVESNEEINISSRIHENSLINKTEHGFTSLDTTWQYLSTVILARGKALFVDTGNVDHRHHHHSSQISISLQYEMRLRCVQTPSVWPGS